MVGSLELLILLVVNHYDFDEWQTLRYINLHVFARRHDEANSTTNKEIASVEKHRFAMTYPSYSA